MRSDKAVNSPQANKERTLHVHMSVESLRILLPKCILQLFFNLRLVINLFLIFHQISGSCSYKVVLMSVTPTFCSMLKNLACFHWIFDRWEGDVPEIECRSVD